MIFKVEFNVIEKSPGGGTAKRFQIFRLFDAETGEELENKIKEEIADNDCGYTDKKVTDISRL